MQLGIDLGGTKTEIIALDRGGVETYRKRVPTPARDYDAILATIAGLVAETETALGGHGTVGVGIPGILSARTGLVKNANTTVLIGRPLDRDLARVLGREVRCRNDADCLALSEALDGAGQGRRVVFAAILGTGCGAGVAIDGRPWTGPNLVAGEWGHNPLPWMTPDEFPGPACWCGKSGCIETWISGTGFSDEYERAAGSRRTAEDIVARARQGDPQAGAALDRYVDRLARALAQVVNLLDPDVIVLGGGMSNIDELYELIPTRLTEHVFGHEVATPVLRSRHGDSSGVRGAARLWPAN